MRPNGNFWAAIISFDEQDINNLGKYPSLRWLILNS